MSVLAIVKAVFPDLLHVFHWQEVAVKRTSMSVSPAPAAPKAHSGATISSTDTSACASLDTQVSAARYAYNLEPAQSVFSLENFQ